MRFDACLARTAVGPSLRVPQPPQQPREDAALDARGFTILQKRLELGTFDFATRLNPDVPRLEVGAHELAMLLEGIDLSRARLAPRWAPGDPARSTKTTTPTDSPSAYFGASWTPRSGHRGRPDRPSQVRSILAHLQLNDEPPAPRPRPRAPPELFDV